MVVNPVPLTGIGPAREQERGFKAACVPSGPTILCLGKFGARAHGHLPDFADLVFRAFKATSHPS
jgi:hypothetical protein